MPLVLKRAAAKSSLAPLPAQPPITILPSLGWIATSVAASLVAPLVEMKNPVGALKPAVSRLPLVLYRATT